MILLHEMRFILLHKIQCVTINCIIVDNAKPIYEEAPQLRHFGSNIDLEIELHYIKPTY